MIKRIILLLLIFSHLANGWEFVCPGGCGGPSDPSVRDAAEICLRCLEKIEFLEPEMWASTSEEEERTYGKIHAYQTKEITWEALHTTSMEEEDRYYFSRIQCKWEELIDFSTRFENYLKTKQLIQYIAQDIELFFDEHKKEREESIQGYREELETLDRIEDREERQCYQGCITKEMKSIARMQKKRDQRRVEFEKTRVAVHDLYRQSFTYCSKYHNWMGAHYGKGLISFEKGELEDAFDSVAQLIDLCKERRDPLPTEVDFQKGLIEGEVGYYNDAILSLSLAIKKDPKNKEAYFERAVAYFEVGKFKESLSDYLASGLKSEDTSTESSFSLDYASGLLAGMKKGVREEFGEMLPMWAPIMNVGLWALIHSPVPSAKLITATLSCIAVVGTYLTADRMVTELKELVTNWDQLSERSRGELAGYLIGKYGVDVFAFAGSAKIMEAYRDLKRANNLLNFEIVLADQVHLAQIKIKYKAIERFKKDEFYIQKTFGRKACAEVEIRSHLLKKGYFIPNRPAGIPENFIVRFSDRGCGISYHDPANPNYNYIRLMPGKPHSPHPRQQTSYIVHVRNGQTLDEKGIATHKNKPEVHISPEEYIYRP